MTADPLGRRARRGAFAAAALCVWALVVLVLGSFLLAGHLVSLPAPAMAGERLTATLAARPGARPGLWSAVHVLYEGCGCSSRVLSHLTRRTARPDLDETVIYARAAGAGPPSADEAATAAAVRSAGFRFEALTPAELETRYQVESAPLLLVADPGGVVRYAGGYTDRSGGKPIFDLTIIDGLKSGHAVQALPVFGCAVSSRVQRAIDPLGLKYPKETKP